MSLGVRSLNGSTEVWTWATTIVGTVTEGCGTYGYLQATGPSPAYATGWGRGGGGP